MSKVSIKFLSYQGRAEGGLRAGGERDGEIERCFPKCIRAFVRSFDRRR